jgi:hypothetical protein
MTTTINASTSSGLVVTPDNSGNVLLQYNGVAAPAFSASNAANQAVTSGALTKVNLATEEFDTNNNFSSSRFTPTVAGYYQMNLALVGYSSSTQITNISVFLYKNGSQYSYSQTYSSAQVIVSVSFPIVVYANGTTDYFEMYGVITGANSFFSGGGDRTSNFSGCLLRGA